MTREKVVEFCSNVFGVLVDHSDIKAAHFIKARRPDATTQTLVRFTSRIVNDRILYARGALEQKNIGKADSEKHYINKDLTNLNMKLFGAARDKLKNKLLFGTARDKLKNKLVTSAWTSNGRVHIKTADGTSHIIFSITQLNHIAH